MDRAVTVGQARQRRRGIWQPRFYEHTIRDADDLHRHLDYIHYNPVKHGVAACPHAWPHSSFGRWVERGGYAADWGCTCNGRRAESIAFDWAERLEEDTGRAERWTDDARRAGSY